MRVLSVFGARPQFIKAAVVQRAMLDVNIDLVSVHTGQHYDVTMSRVFFDELAIPEPQYNLGVGSGMHGWQTGEMLAGIETILAEERPDWVLVFGDTNSTLAGALAAVKLHIPVAHVEAGLRSFNRRMPEEINRVLADHISTVLFAPTDTAVENLRSEGIAAGSVKYVGDVMYDAIVRFGPIAEELIDLGRWGLRHGEYALCTVHRQENTDDPRRLRGIMSALSDVSRQLPIIFPLHPRTRNALATVDEPLAPSVHLVDPASYLEIQRLTMSAALVLTDSGGLQKEAYFHGVPCVTLRDETEWVETVDAGWNIIAGAEPSRILGAVEAASSPPSARPLLYGDGQASARIAAYLADTRVLE